MNHFEKCSKCKGNGYVTNLASSFCHDCCGIGYSIDSIREHTNGELLEIVLHKMNNAHSDAVGDSIGDNHIYADKLLCILLVGLKLTDNQMHCAKKIQCDIVEKFNIFEKWYV